MPGAGLRAPLRRPVFRRLAVSYALNEMGDWMGVIALSVLVFDETGSAIATAVLFLATQFLPALVAPLFVAKAELPPPRVTLPVIYAVEALVFAALALLVADFSLPAVVALATLDGVLSIGSRAITRSVVVTLLEPSGELRAGNAILNVAFTWGAAIGPAIAGVAVAQLGVQAALLLDAASFCAMGWILVSCRGLPRPETEEGTLRARVRAGLRHIRRRARLRRLLSAQAAAFVFFSAVIPVEVIFAKETLGVGDSGYGFLLASWGGGMVVGGLAFAALRRAPLPALLLFSTIAVGVSYLGMAASPTLAVACAAAAVGGAGNGVQWVGVISAVQELTATPMQGRVLSVLESIGAAMPGVGYMLGGVIAAEAGPRATFVVAGVGVLAVVLLFAPMLGRSWPELASKTRSRNLDGRNEPVLELIPSIRNSLSSDSEVSR